MDYCPPVADGETAWYATAWKNSTTSGSTAHMATNEELMGQGLARVFNRYCNRPVCQEWQLLETEARQNKRGLWSTPNPIPPWEFRRSRR